MTLVALGLTATSIGVTVASIFFATTYQWLGPETMPSSLVMPEQVGVVG